MIASIRALILSSTLILSACSASFSVGGFSGEFPSNGSSCKPRVLDRIFFGMNTPQGVVTETQWQDFLRDKVTPRFPEGLSVFQAHGQWLGADKTIAHESSRVLELVHDDSSRVHDDIHTVCKEYKEAFQQEAVMVIRSQVEACF